MSTFPSLSNGALLDRVHSLGGAAIGQLQAYEEAAWLAQHIFSLDHNPANNTEVAEMNWAIWEIFDPGTNLSNSSYYNSLTHAQQTAIAGDVTLAATHYAGGNYSNVVIYTPTGDAYTTSGAPQEFIGITPEPGALLLLAVGLFSMVAFRKRFALA